jgi:predicted ABC-type ATPase
VAGAQGGRLKPVLLVVAGPNGAGKTTVTARLRAERWSEGVEYLNPDEIARDRFGDWNSPDAILKAAEWTKRRREELLAQGAGIAFETVLSTEEKIDFLARARGAGYFIRVFFIATADPRINAARVADRVLAGGHAVPIEKIHIVPGLKGGEMATERLSMCKTREILRQRLVLDRAHRAISASVGLGVLAAHVPRTDDPIFIAGLRLRSFGTLPGVPVPTARMCAAPGRSPP